jgi:hypothetical protein
MKKGDCSQPQQKKSSLDYEEGRLQSTPAGHPKGEPLSTGYFTCVVLPVNLF